MAAIGLPTIDYILRPTSEGKLKKAVSSLVSKPTDEFLEMLKLAGTELLELGSHGAFLSYEDTPFDFYRTISEFLLKRQQLYPIEKPWSHGNLSSGNAYMAYGCNIYLQGIA